MPFFPLLCAGWLFTDKAMLAERETHRPEWIFLAALIFINLAAKGAFLGINTGEYTDGVLQLTVFSTKAGLYPPLYGALAHGLSFAGLSLETAGRLVSLCAAALCVVPVYWMGRQLAGAGAARLAGLLFTVAPMPWRWSVRVMTDSLFLLLSTLAMVLLVGTCGRDRRLAARCLAGAVAAAGLASLTRYQGVLFAPLLIIVLVMFFRQFKSVPWLSVVAGGVWLLVPAWMAWNGFAHQGQFTSRTALTPLATVIAWWNTVESFVLISPYYFGYPLFVAAVAGLFSFGRGSAQGGDAEAAREVPLKRAFWCSGDTPPRINAGAKTDRLKPVNGTDGVDGPNGMGKLDGSDGLDLPDDLDKAHGLVDGNSSLTDGFAEPVGFHAAAWLWSAYAIMLLGLHAAFGSFQYRYMMPLLPIVVALAAVGFLWLERAVSGRRWIYSVALMASVIYLAFFSLAVVVLQREAFGDQREAAAFIRDGVPANTPIYANERYGSFTNLGAVKLSFWSGRRVSTLLSPDQLLEPGSVVVLGTAYGGDEAVGALMQALSERYTLQPLMPQPFRSQLTPLMDDIMTDPMFNQNPLGWVMRYSPQYFATQLFVVRPKKSVLVADGGTYGS